MLTITVHIPERYDETNEQFLKPKDCELQLEHSLVSISKWESTWCTPFLSKESKTIVQTMDYIRCMTINQKVDPEVYNYISDDNISKVKDYIDSDMTATKFLKNDNKINREIITSEKIYYWMIALNIPYKYEQWHLNRLLTLINVCNIQNSPPKKMSKKEIISNNRALNEARKKEWNTNG